MPTCPCRDAGKCLDERFMAAMEEHTLFEDKLEARVAALEQQRDSRPAPAQAAAPAQQPGARPCDKCDWSGDRPDCEDGCDAWTAWCKGYLLNETPAQRPSQQPRSCFDCRFKAVDMYEQPCYGCHMSEEHMPRWQPREGGGA